MKFEILRILVSILARLESWNQANSYSLVASQYWVAQQLVPIISKLQERIPLTIPSLYSPQVQKYYQVPSELDCREVNLTDQYFDTFHHKWVIYCRKESTWLFCSIYFCLPRSYSTWQTVVTYQVEDDERIKFSNLESRYLTQSSNVEYRDPISEYAEEDKDIEAELSISKYQFTSAASSSYTVLPSSFSIQAALNAEKSSPPHKYSKEKRIELTEKYRKAALKAKEPQSIDELAVTVEPLFK